MAPLTPPEAVVFIILGLVALLLGKRLFWLFAGIVGFALGWWLTDLLLTANTNPILLLLVEVVAGLVVAGLARFLGRWAIRIVAAIAGFVVLPTLLRDLGMLGDISQFSWGVIGAVAGFVFALFLTNWTLIFLSSILGAGLILNGAQTFISLSEAVRMIVGFILIALGVVVQSRQKG